MKIALAADHVGFSLKEKVREYLKSKGLEVEDYGPSNAEPVDYPDFAEKVAGEVAAKQADYGVLVCGTGIGMSIAANKVEGIRAGVVYDERTARVSRSHNDTNVLCLGEDTVQGPLLDPILEIWLATPAEAGRHERRVGKIMEYERRKRAAQKTAQA